MSVSRIAPIAISGLIALAFGLLHLYLLWWGVRSEDILRPYEDLLRSILLPH